MFDGRVMPLDMQNQDVVFLQSPKTGLITVRR